MLKFIYLIFLISKISFASNLDLGFRQGQQYLKTNLNDDYTAIQFDLIEIKTNKEIILTKKSVGCFLKTDKILDSLSTLSDTLSPAFKQTEIEKLAKDLQLLSNGSGYSEFLQVTDFLKIFHAYLSSVLPKDCLNF